MNAILFAGLNTSCPLVVYTTYFLLIFRCACLTHLILHRRQSLGDSYVNAATIIDAKYEKVDIANIAFSQ